MTSTTIVTSQFLKSQLWTLENPGFVFIFDKIKQQTLSYKSFLYTLFIFEFNQKIKLKIIFKLIKSKLLKIKTNVF